MSSSPSPPPANWRKPAIVFLVVLLAGGGAGVYFLDRASRDRRVGLEAAAAGNFKVAEPSLKKALDRDPSDADVVAALARGYAKADDPTNADTYLARWVELRPADLEARKARYEFLRTASRNADAYAEGRKLLELDPGNSQLRRMLVLLAFSSGEFAAAEDLCRTCQREFPNDIDLKILLANILRAKGDTAAAVGVLDGVLTQTPPATGQLRSRALLARAILHEEADEPAKAVPLLREMLQIDKTRQRTAGMRLAVSLERAGMKDEAAKALAEVRRMQDVMTVEDAVASQPDNLELRVRQGEALLEAGHHADGVRLLMSVFDFDSRYRPAHKALAAHFEKTGQADKAAQHRRAAGDPR